MRPALPISTSCNMLIAEDLQDDFGTGHSLYSS